MQIFSSGEKIVKDPILSAQLKLMASRSMSHTAVFHFQHQWWDIGMNWTWSLEIDVLVPNKCTRWLPIDISSWPYSSNLCLNFKPFDFGGCRRD